ncbi:MAG: PQQ-dependent sugar dehydrogenase [Bacteroidota bacterium]|nr:PQQ-dependent sugar dehydrogenase [Bacteroidota bacterium]
MLKYILLLTSCCFSVTAFSQSENVHIKLSTIATGFTSPVGMAAPNDGTGRIFVFEQGGKIKIVKNGKVNKDPFLDISSRLDGLNIAYSEKGLLGMAFHPDYKSNGRFFVYYSAPNKLPKFDHKSVVAEYKVSAANADQADMKEIIIMEILQPESNHNGGMLAFGPDGFLYIGTGDGGGANDEHGTIGNGQDLNTLLGKILRIDINKEKPYGIPADNPFVGKSNHRGEIYAYGLRNPWRFSFDNLNGKLFCGDVGQNKYEEINIIEKGGNYGWRIMEGFHCFNPSSGCDKTGLKLPIAEYDHDTGISICGGHIYRGNSYPSLHGFYFYGDWSGKLFCLKRSPDNTWKKINVNVNGTSSNDINGKLNSMGEDANGDVYLLTQRMFGPRSTTGVLMKITP